MPEYYFKHPKKNKYISIIMGMNDTHEYTDEKGVKWDREWTVPQAAINTHFDPYSEKDFVKNTDNKKDSMGALWDRAKEASLKREQRNGIDPIKEKFMAAEKKRRKGKPCMEEIKKNRERVITI